MNYRYDLLQWRRQKTGRTYAELAERCGLRRSVIHDVVRGKTSDGRKSNPKIETLTAVCESLDIDRKYALDDSLKTERQFRRAVVATAR